MAKEELIEFEGLVTEILPDTRYRVKLDTGHEIIAYTAGKMKKNRIKTLAGDRVIVEMSPYDLEKGRIIFRHKDDRASTSRPPMRQQFRDRRDRKSTRLNSSHQIISYAVFCLKKKNTDKIDLNKQLNRLNNRC